MSLMKWEPRELEPFDALRSEVDHLFEDFTRGWPRAFFSRTLPSVSGQHMPSVDLKETDVAYTLTADLPGITKEDLKVNITERAVTIEGERKEEKEKSLKGYHLRESSYGSFRRVTALPDEVVADKSKATLKDGVLTLVLPKAKQSDKRHVRNADEGIRKIVH
jgi:HSP20 family protein